MDKDRIVMSHIMLELTDGFQERLALNITDCTTNLDDGKFCPRLRILLCKNGS